MRSRLRHRITLQTRTDVQDARGNVTEIWVDAHPDVPADWLPGPGREYLAGEAIRNEVSGRFVIRYQPGIVPQMRAIWDGQPWRILAVLPDATARRELILMVNTDGED